MSHPGIFISFEGTEGAGKSTQINLLAAKLKQSKKDVICLREPGGTPIGECIRDLLKNPAYSSMSPQTELLLFEASRAQLVQEVILPALEKDCIILCDRFFDSTTVYQGIARNIDASSVAWLNHFASQKCTPNITIILDIPAQLGFERIKTRNASQNDRMEQEKIEFYEAVRQGYLHLANQYPQRFFVVDATKEPSTIQNTIWNYLLPLLK